MFFIPILSALLLAINILIAGNNPYEDKVSAYECGMPVIIGQTRSTFHIHFMTVALLFLIFDLEIILFLPVAVSLYQVSFFGLAMSLMFFSILTVGFVMEIGSGAVKLTTNK